jgi:hypothetical protein
MPQVSMYFPEVYFAVLMCLPLLGYWRGGLRGAAIGTVAALVFAVAFHFGVPMKSPPPPADWNPEAKSEWNRGAAMVGFILTVLIPAAAILCGMALVAALALIRFAISFVKRKGR